MVIRHGVISYLYIGHVFSICVAPKMLKTMALRAVLPRPHPCSITGTYVCEGVDCGDNSKDERHLICWEVTRNFVCESAGST